MCLGHTCRTLMLRSLSPCTALTACTHTCPSPRPRHGAELWELSPTTVRRAVPGTWTSSLSGCQPTRPGGGTQWPQGRQWVQEGELTSTVAAAGGAPRQGRPSGRGGVSVAPILLQEL